MRNFLSDRKYILGFLLIYLTALGILYFQFHQSLEDSLTVALVFGIAFPVISWLLVRNTVPAFSDPPAFKNEILVLLFLIIWITWYISIGTGWINSLVPKSFFTDPRLTNIYVLIKKLSVFVLVPFLIYKMFGFSVADFGFSIRTHQIFSRKTILVFLILSVVILVFQWLAGQGANTIRNGNFSGWQLLYGIPLCYVWNIIEAGLVEEFFFRSLLQSRLAVWFKSGTAGILLSGLIFGLAHAPGLFLRGAQSEGITEQLPFLFWAAFTISMMSMAGIFLGILWNRTKNIFLIIALHAMVDLIPNLADFIHDWHL